MYPFNLSPILEAARTGDQAALEKEAAKGVKLNSIKETINERSFTILHAAALGGQRAIIEWLVKTQKINMLVKNNKGESILHIAALGGQVELAKWLLTQDDFSLIDTNDNGENLFHLAAEGNEYDFIVWLTKQPVPKPTGWRKWIDDKTDFSLNTKDFWGRTPMHIAAKKGYQPLLELLFELALSPYAYYGRDRAGRNVLHHAAWGGHLALIKTSNEKYNFALDDKDYFGENILHYAARGGHQPIIEWLITTHDFDLHEKTGPYIDERGYKAGNGPPDKAVSLSDVEALSVVDFAAKNKHISLISWFATQGMYVMNNITTMEIFIKDKVVLISNKEHDEIVSHYKVFEENKKVLKRAEKLIAGAEVFKSEKFKTAYAALETDQFTHEHRLLLLSFARPVQMLLDYKTKNSLHDLRFIAFHHKKRCDAIAKTMCEVQPLAKEILQNPNIIHNWVRIRIWNSGYYDASSSSSSSAPQYVTQGAVGLAFLALRNRLPSFSQPGLPSSNSNVGHVSIETAQGYMSFWPAEGPGGKNIHDLTRGYQATMHNLVQDEQAEGPQGGDCNKFDKNKSLRPPDKTFTLYTLDAQRINEYCQEMCGKIADNTLQFSLFGAKNTKVNGSGRQRLLNCVTLSYNLLLSGGLEGLIPRPESTYPVNQILDPYWMECLMQRAELEEDKRTHRGAHCVPVENLNVAPFSHPELSPCSIADDIYKVKQTYAAEGILLEVNDELALIVEDDSTQTKTFLTQPGQKIVLPNATVQSYLEALPKRHVHSLIPGKKKGQSSNF